VSRGPVADLQPAEIQSCELIAHYPETGVEFNRVPSGRGAFSLSDRTTLRSSPDIQFIGGVLIDSKTCEPVLYTENLFLEFSDAHNRDEYEECITQAGLLMKKQVSYSANVLFCQAPKGTGQTIFSIAEQFLKCCGIPVRNLLRSFGEIARKNLQILRRRKLMMLAC
jgi:hypothetical protein